MAEGDENGRATVIVPVYNRSGLICRCLDSIVGQGYRPLRIIVADNASTDGTAETVARWMENRHGEAGLETVLLAETRRGAAAARQTGFESAFGPDDRASREVVFFFDSDDTMRPGLIGAAMSVMEADPSADLVCWRIMTHTLGGKTVPSKPLPSTPSLDFQLVHAFLSTQRYAARASLLFAAGGWDRSMTVWDDWELGVRLMLQNPAIKVIDEPLVDVYSQEESITGTGFAPKAGAWEKVIAHVYGILSASDAPDRERLMRVVAYRSVILAAHYHREGRKALAGPLMRKALATPGLGALRRLALRYAYHHTKYGLRGAYTLIGRLL